MKELLNQIGPVYIAIGAIGAAAVFYKPFWGLLAMAFMIPLEAIVSLSAAFTAIKAVGLLTFMAYGFHFLAKKESFRLDYRVLLPLFFFLMWTTIRFGAHYSDLFKLLQFALLFMLVISLCSKNEFRILSIISAYTVGCLAGIILSALNYLGASATGARATLEGQDANMFSAIIGVGMLFLFLIIRPKFKRYMVLIPYGLTILFIYGLISGASRTASIAMAAVLFIYFFIERNRLKNMANLLMIVLVLGAILTVGLQKGLIREDSLNRIESAQSYQDTTLSIRFWIWGVGLRMIENNFFLGVGLGKFNSTFEKYTGEAWGPHNTYLLVFAETGVIGFLIYMWFLSSFFYLILKAHAENRASVFCILLFIMIFSLTLKILFAKFFWLSLALAYSLSTLTPSEQLPPTERT